MDIFANITLGKGKAVHATNVRGNALCGAGASRPNGGATSVLERNETNAAVTCRRCVAGLHKHSWTADNLRMEKEEKVSRWLEAEAEWKAQQEAPAAEVAREADAPRGYYRCADCKGYVRDDVAECQMCADQRAQEVPAGHIACDECGKAVPANFKDVTRHAAECFGASAHVYADEPDREAAEREFAYTSGALAREDAQRDIDARRVVVTYAAARDVQRADNDEHAAMAHVSIAQGEDFGEVRASLTGYIESEAQYFDERAAEDRARGRIEPDQWTQRRAGRLRALAAEASEWSADSFEPGRQWQALTVSDDNLMFRIIRTEYKA